MIDIGTKVKIHSKANEFRQESFPGISKFEFNHTNVYTVATSESGPITDSGEETRVFRLSNGPGANLTRYGQLPIEIENVLFPEKCLVEFDEPQERWNIFDSTKKK